MERRLKKPGKDSYCNYNKLCVPDDKYQISLHILNPSMPRLLSSKAQERRNYWKLFKPCHVGIHLKALAESYQMNTYLAVFLLFLHYFLLTKLASNCTRVDINGYSLCCWWLIWPIQSDTKNLKNCWKPGKWVLIWEYSERAANEYHYDRV